MESDSTIRVAAPSLIASTPFILLGDGDWRRGGAAVPLVVHFQQQAMCPDRLESIAVRLGVQRIGCYESRPIEKSLNGNRNRTTLVSDVDRFVTADLKESESIELTMIGILRRHRFQELDVEFQVFWFHPTRSVA